MAFRALLLALCSAAICGQLLPFTPGNVLALVASAGAARVVELSGTTGATVQSTVLRPFPLGCVWGMGGEGGMSPDGFVSSSSDFSAACFSCGPTAVILRANGSATWTTFAGLTLAQTPNSNCATDGAGSVWLAAGQSYSGPNLLWYAPETANGTSTPVALLTNTSMRAKGGFSRSLNFALGNLWMFVYTDGFYRLSGVGGLRRSVAAAGGHRGGALLCRQPARVDERVALYWGIS